MKKTSITQDPGSWLLERLQVSGGTGQMSTATATLKTGQQTVKGSGAGNGLISAAVDAISLLTGTRGRLAYGSFNPKFRGQPATYETTISVNFNGSVFAGKGTSSDIVEASAQAYLDAVNQHLTDQGDKTRREDNSSI